MSKQAALNLIRELESLSVLVITESDEVLAEALNELEIICTDGDE